MLAWFPKSTKIWRKFIKLSERKVNLTLFYFRSKEKSAKNSSAAPALSDRPGPSGIKRKATTAAGQGAKKQKKNPPQEEQEDDSD